MRKQPVFSSKQTVCRCHPKYCIFPVQNTLKTSINQPQQYTLIRDVYFILGFHVPNYVQSEFSSFRFNRLISVLVLIPAIILSVRLRYGLIQQSH